MSAAVFEQSLARVVELRDQTQTDVLVAFCGTGEPLLNPGRVAYLKEVRKAGFDCVISSNGALLDEGVGRALLEAGLRKICLNVSELGAAYEKVYGLPFERTRDNVARFVQMAGDECDVFVVIVDYTDDAAHVSRKTDYWRAFGIQRFIRYDLINRGGSLAVNGMEFDRQPQVDLARAMFMEAGSVPVCVVPFIHGFVGYDGQYYLCSSDWQKDVPLGSVFDTSLTSIIDRKLEHVTRREPICKSCSLDPINRLAALLRRLDESEASTTDKDLLITEIVEHDRMIKSRLEEFVRAYPADTRSSRGPHIPVRAS